MGGGGRDMARGQHHPYCHGAVDRGEPLSGGAWVPEARPTGRAG
jgi:hypothetical protein